MKEVKMILPNLASDTAGAASALFSLGGLTVIHDAAGSLEVFINYEEARELDEKRTVGSKLNRLDAITGNDQVLLDKILAECEVSPPPFIAIIGSPVPFTIGTDLNGIAAEVENLTGIPAFAVTAGGFGTYDKGAGEAMKKLIQKCTYSPVPHVGSIVNLLGATPMDYSSAEIQGVCYGLKTEGWDQVRTLTMAEGMDEIYHAAEADMNLVISVSGLAAAKFMKQKHGIPYSIGLPTKKPSLPGSRVLVLGEAIFSKLLCKNLTDSGSIAVAGIIGTDKSEIFPEVTSIQLDAEQKIMSELKNGYDIVIGDPLYKLLLPKDFTGIYIERPHRALSGRLFPPNQHALDVLI